MAVRQRTEIASDCLWRTSRILCNGLFLSGCHSFFFVCFLFSPAGLKQIHALSIQGNYELRIDLEDFENSTAYAHYGTFGVGLFSVDPDDDGYPLTVGDYSGNAGDSLLKHNGMKFTTKDRDNDHSENNCASFYHGAWWYRNCHTSNLNGQYLRGQHTSYADGIEWSSWTGWQYSLKFSEMKIRPTRDPDNK
uniref:Fibrinogen C-terminal domain-containing protein n=1 Tax=Xiphophorus couchianus TaxID=32473 RepID=A0A3B5M0C6_9TELE